jgi:hypothetical protein
LECDSAALLDLQVGVDLFLTSSLCGRGDQDWGVFGPCRPRFSYLRVNLYVWKPQHTASLKPQTLWGRYPTFKCRILSNRFDDVEAQLRRNKLLNECTTMALSVLGYPTATTLLLHSKRSQPSPGHSCHKHHVIYCCSTHICTVENRISAPPSLDDCLMLEYVFGGLDLGCLQCSSSRLKLSARRHDSG